VIAADVVARESAAWVWYPEDARLLGGEEFLIVRWPAWFGTEATVVRFSPAATDDAAVEAAFETACGSARADGVGALSWTHRMADPPRAEELLLARGAEIHEAVDVLARPLDEMPDLAPPAEVEVRWTLDVDTAADSQRVAIAGFGEGEMPPPERIEEIAAEESAATLGGLGGRVVAYLDGEAVGTCGLTIAGRTARIWSAATIPSAERRGVFRACLDEVLAYAAAHGADMVLVKGRIETSAPIFRRAGFEVYGQERTYRLAL